MTKEDSRFWIGVAAFLTANLIWEGLNNVPPVWDMAYHQYQGWQYLKAWQQEAWVRVQVKDAGRGIPRAIRGRIFDPFFTTKEVGKGTGLGLSLCYGIVHKYGGRIDFSSVSKEDNPEVPSGTTFTVSMPLYKG